MITLREFLKMIKYEHYRIYQPNRDCLIFESYLKVHSPYTFDGSLRIQHDYYANNDYCDLVYFKHDIEIDEETEKFLNEFGDMEVFSVECASFRPMKCFKDEKGNLQIEYVRDKYRTESDYIECFNIFIAPYNAKHSRGCSLCWHSRWNNNNHQPDEDDIECKNCPNFKK